MSQRPGAVNAHTHLYSGLAPLGMPAPEPPPENFVQILERVWWRLDRALDAASLRASARLYMAEALLAGTTTLIDHHESPALIDGSLDILADAAEELGIRLVTCYGVTERNGGRPEARAGLDECRRFVEGRTGALVRGMVGVHAAFTVSDETLREAGALARKLGVGVHIHVAEDGADVDDAQGRGYPGVLGRLLETDALPRGSILAHGVHLSPDEVRRADDAGLWFVQNPRSNEGNGVGFARSLGSSHHVALGTDGYPAVMSDESAALARLAKAHGDAVSDGEQAARAAASETLASAIFGDSLGDDFVEDAAGPEQDGRPVQVTVDGQRVVDGGELVRANIEEIRADAEQQAAALWKRMAAL